MSKKKYIVPSIEQTTCVMMKFVMSSGDPEDPTNQSGNESPGNMAPRRVF